MKYLDKIRADIAAKLAERAALLDTMQAVGDKAADESRSMTAEETVSFDEARGKITALDAEVLELNERAAELEAIEARTAEVAKMKSITFQTPAPEPTDVISDRSATPTQLADAATRSIKAKVDERGLAGAREVFERHASHRDWARSMIARSTPAYTDAFKKLITGNQHLLLPEEQRAMIAVEEYRATLTYGTAAAGGYLVPTHLDPSVIPTNNGTADVIRGLSRQVTLTTGNVWNGISSAGVTSSWDGEVVEVSDDSPTFTKPTISTHIAQTFIEASYAVLQDVDSLEAELLMMLADSKTRLEAAAHATGSGSGQPYGIFTNLNANTNVQITSTTAATIGLVDLHAMYAGLPVRWRGNAAWVGNPVPLLAVKSLGTALSASYTADATSGNISRLLGSPVYECDEAPNVTTTTALDNRLILGDFSAFVVVDMPGSTTIQFFPGLVSATTNRPDGRVGWFQYWRHGSKSVNDLSFRLLVDKTSA